MIVHNHGEFQIVMEQVLHCTRKADEFENVRVQYEPMIHKIILQLHITHDREEFFAEGSLALYEAFLNFKDEKGNFSAYAFATIRGTLLKKIRKEHQAAQAGTLELCGEMGYHPTTNWENSLFIQQVFRNLSIKEKRMFILVFLQDQPIATAIQDPSLNLTYRQGKYLVQGIRKKFQKEWGHYQQQD